jgi:hypothetical protein
MVDSVVIFIVNILNVRAGKFEGYAPVSAHPDSPTALPVTFQGMKLQSWQRHVSRLDRYVEPAQNKTKPTGMRHFDSGGSTAHEEAFQSLMSEF